MNTDLPWLRVICVTLRLVCYSVPPWTAPGSAPASRCHRFLATGQTSAAGASSATATASAATATTTTTPAAAAAALTDSERRGAADSAGSTASVRGARSGEDGEPKPDGEAGAGVDAGRAGGDAGAAAGPTAAGRVAPGRTRW